MYTASSSRNAQLSLDLVLFKFSYSRFQCFGKHNNHGGLNSSLEMSLLTLLDLYTFVQILVFWCFGGDNNHGTCKKKVGAIVHCSSAPEVGYFGLDWDSCRSLSHVTREVLIAVRINKILFALDILVRNSRKLRASPQWTFLLALSEQKRTAAKLFCLRSRRNMICHHHHHHHHCHHDKRRHVRTNVICLQVRPAPSSFTFSTPSTHTTAS